MKLRHMAKPLSWTFLAVAAGVVALPKFPDNPAEAAPCAKIDEAVLYGTDLNNNAVLSQFERKSCPSFAGWQTDDLKFDIFSR